MPVILLALVALAVVAFVIFWFMRANPSTLARLLRPFLVVLGVIGIGGMLIFGLRFLPGLLPELLPVPLLEELEDGEIAITRSWT